MTKKKKQRIEQEKIKLWKMQGLSDAEIEKKLEKSRKNEKTKTTIKWVIVGGAIIALSIGAYKVVDKIISDQQTKLTPDEQKNLEEKKKDEEKLKEDISKDVPDKDPNDIIIPKVPTKEEGASDEEIAEAEKKAEEAKQEKEYWTTVKETKDKVSDNIEDQISKITNNDPNFDEIRIPVYLRGFQKVRRINNAYVMDDGSLVVDCDYLYRETFPNGESVLRQMNASFRFINKNLESKFDDMQSMIDFMQNEETTSEMFGMNNGLEMEELKDVYYNHLNHLGLLYDYGEDGAKIELEKITAYEYDGESPIHYYCISKVTSGATIKYVITDATSQVKTQGMSMDEWKAWAKDPSDKSGVFKVYEYELSPLNFDWKALSEKYSGQKTQEEQVQNVIDSFSSLDENGEEVLDYPAFKQFDQQQQAEKEAKELEQKMRQEAKVTYSEQELGF